MVDPDLFNRFLQLDVAARREFVRAAQGTLDYEEVPAEVLAEIERRLAEAGPSPATDYVTLDEFRHEIASRRNRHTA